MTSNPNAPLSEAEEQMIRDAAATFHGGTMPIRTVLVDRLLAPIDELREERRELRTAFDSAVGLAEELSDNVSSYILGKYKVAKTLDELYAVRKKYPAPISFLEDEGPDAPLPMPKAPQPITLTPELEGKNARD